MHHDSLLPMEILSLPRTSFTRKLNTRMYFMLDLLIYRSHSSIPLTGDSRADADIIAFYRARQKLIQKGKLLCMQPL